MKHKLFTFFLTLVASVNAIYASNTKVNGIWYDFDSSTKTASVTYRGSSYSIYEGEYSGLVVIPSSVTYNGTTYSVTSIGEWAFASCSSLTSVTIPNSVTSIGNLAFSGCSSLTKTNYTGDVAGWCNINFGINANPMLYSHNFYINDQEIKDLVIPNSVTSIGNSAFYGCSSLTSVTIPNSVTSIGSSAFRGCSSLTSVTIPNSVTSIGEWAFASCSSLTSVTIGESVTNIGGYAFYGCSSLTSVTIGESVTNIGGYAFYGCSSLTSVTIPNSVTSIGDYAFSDCSSLTSITCKAATPPSVGSETFMGISRSIPINVPCGGVKAYKAKSGWKDFTNIQEPLAEYSIEVNVNDNIMGSAKVNYNTCEGSQISATPNIGYHFVQWSDGNTKNPRTLELTQDTILIAKFALTQSGQCGDNLYWELIDDTLHITGSGEMYDYSSDTAPWKRSIKVLRIGECVTSIGSSAFRGCSSLTSVTIPNSVTSIGSSAFRGCSSLTSVTIGESVTSIGNLAFYGCSSLTSVIINSNAIVSKDYSSYDDNISDIFGSQVTEYIIGDDVKGIGRSAFYDCSSLTSVTIPNSVTSIGNYAFENCSSLTSVTIPNSVTSIGNLAFSGCSSLTSVTIGESVTNIGGDAFSGCSSLTKTNYTGDVAGWCNINFGGSYANPMLYSHNFYINDQEIKDLVIPNSVTSIGNSAFENCSSLTSVTIPESVTSIGNSAFSGCSSLTKTNYTGDVAGWCNINFGGSYANPMLYSHNFYINDQEIKDLVIPNSVTSIGNSAFYGCSSLTSVTIGESVTSIGNSAFNGCSSLASVTIGNSVTSIGNYAFENCSSLASVTIGNSVTSIGSSAFRGCSSLTSVTIGESVTSIGGYAFRNCSSLTSITCKAENPPTIGYDVFYDVSKSIPVYVPCGCVGAYKAKNGWEDFTNIQEPLAEYSIEVDVNDNIMGTAKVDINSACGNQISATPNFGYHLVQWSDGNTDNPRSLVLTQDTILTAEFAPNKYTITTISSDIQRGTTQGDTVVNYLDIVTICANANYGYHFTQWNDANIENPRQVQVTGDTTYTAIFDKNTYTISLSCNEEQGRVEGVTSAEYLDTVTISATPNIGYHFVQWNDGNSDTIRTLVLTQDTILTAEFAQSRSGQCGANLYWELLETTLHITGSGEMYHYISDTAPWKLLVNSIKSLTIAEDVTSIERSAFSGCSAIESIVWSARNYANPANKEVAPFYDIRSQIKSFTFGEAVEHIPAYLCYGMDKLTSVTIPNNVTSIGEGAFSNCSAIESIVWSAKNFADPADKEVAPFYDIRSQIKSFTFGENVEHIPAYLCYGMDKLTSVTTPNSLKTIGTSAFEGCARLGKISLGTGLEEIAANAFAGCTRLYDIYVYAAYPPFADESSFANYNVYVYIPCEYQRDYTLDVVWGKFKFIECIDSEEATTDGNVTIVPGYNDVTITWPTEDNADNYAIVIEKDGEVFCTLTFNADGQLLNIAFAPARNGDNRPVQYAEQAVSGYRFTVTGLTEATRYAYNVTTKDAANKTIATYSGEFTTKGGITTAVEDILHSTTNCQKLLRDGQLIIIRDGKTYNVMGKAL